MSKKTFVPKYRFMVDGNKITAITRFGGKEVRASATCSPNDTFNFEEGAKLARARCEYKVNLQRYTYASKIRVQYEELLSFFTDIKYKAVVDYTISARKKLNNSRCILNSLEDEMRK